MSDHLTTKTETVAWLTIHPAFEWKICSAQPEICEAITIKSAPASAVADRSIHCRAFNCTWNTEQRLFEGNDPDIDFGIILRNFRCHSTKWRARHPAHQRDAFPTQDWPHAVEHVGWKYDNGPAGFLQAHRIEIIA